MLNFCKTSCGARLVTVLVVISLAIVSNVSALNGPVQIVWASNDCTGEPLGSTQLTSNETAALPYGTCVKTFPESSHLYSGSFKFYCTSGSSGQLISQSFTKNDCSSSTHYSRSIVPTDQCLQFNAGVARSFMFRCSDAPPLTFTGPAAPGTNFGILPPTLGSGGCNPIEVCEHTPYRSLYLSDNCTNAAYPAPERIINGNVGVCYNHTTFQSYTECEVGIIRYYTYYQGCDGPIAAISESHFVPDQCEIVADTPSYVTRQLHCNPNVFPPPPTPASLGNSLSFFRSPTLAIFFLAILALFSL